MFRRHKRKITMTLLLVMILSIVIGAFTQISMADSMNKVITLLHVNDVHGRIEEDDYEGAIGFPKLKTKLDQMKKENPNILLLNAGDTLHGTTEVNLTEGEAMVSMMNMLEFDAMVPGNHDFNYGYERLIELKELADFPIVTSNVYKENGETDFDAYTIKEIDGVKIGIFGLTTEECEFKTHPDYVKGLEFKDPIKTAKKAVKDLEDEEVDIIISLAHLGNDGTSLTTSRDVLKEVEGIDIMVDGHSHEEINEKIGDALLVQAGEYTKNIGRVDIEIEGNEIKKTDVSLITYDEMKDIEPNEKVLKAVEEIKDKNKPILEEVIGETKVVLDGERENVRTKETNLGNLIADTMLNNLEADVAFLNGGDIRASIGKGNITVGDVITTVPFSNTLGVIEVTGEDLLLALERGVDSYPEAAGHFPHVSGMKYSFDPDGEVGNRIVEVTVDGKPIEKSKTYKLVTTDFILAGGDGYSMFENKEVIAEDRLLSDTLMDHIKEVKVVDPKVEGRITLAKQKEIERPKDVSVTIDGKHIRFDEDSGKPFIHNKRTLSPLRVVSEELGHKVVWDGKKRTVTIDDYIVLTIDKKEVKIGNKTKELEVPATIKNGRTYVPIRFISEVLGYPIDWNGDTRTVIINGKKEEVGIEKILLKDKAA